MCSGEWIQFYDWELLFNPTPMTHAAATTYCADRQVC